MKHAFGREVESSAEKFDSVDDNVLAIAMWSSVNGTHNRRKSVVRYFTDINIGFVVAIIPIGVILIYVGLHEPDLTFLLAVGLLVSCGGILGIMVSLRRPSDRQMDTLIDNDLDNVAKRAMVRLNLDDSDLVSETIYVIGPRIWNIAGAKVALRRGKDDRIRYTPIGVTILFFTEHQLIGYQCALDLYTGCALDESTDEYFYRDVVSVSVRTMSETFHLDKADRRAIKGTELEKVIEDDTLHLKKAEKFILTTSGGTALEVILNDPKFLEAVGGGAMPKDRTEKAVTAVRKMLLEKKIK